MSSIASVRFKNSKWLIAVIAALIVLGTYNGVFSMVALVVCGAYIALSSNNDTICMFMFLLPYATIFKSAPGAQSFFTYLLMFYVFYMAITKRRIDKAFSGMVVLLTSLLFAQSMAALNTLRLIKFLINILFVYSVMKSNVSKNYKSIFLWYIAGVLSSSLIVKFGFVNNLNAYAEVKALGLSYGWLERFSGCYGDPNYYAVNVVLAMCLVIVLLHRKDINFVTAVAIEVMLLYFNLLTYSKSALLILIVPMLLMLYSQFKNKRYFFSIVLMVLFIIVAIMTFSGRFSALDTVMRRFEQGSDDITTGRTDIWGNYMDFFKSNPLRLLFGSGMGAELVGGMAPHNTYIDFLYYFGVVGVVIIVLTILFIPKPVEAKQKKCFLNFGAFLCIGVMYFFLSETFYVDLPFHIVISMIAFRLPLNEKRKFDEKTI